MLASSVICAIEHHLRAGLPRRQIAAICGVSKSLVGNVATGRITCAERVELEETPRHSDVSIDATRCPRCNGLTTVAPCQKCLAESRPTVISGPGGHVRVGLDLKPEDHERYEEIRRRRGRVVSDA